MSAYIRGKVTDGKHQEEQKGLHTGIFRFMRMIVRQGCVLSLCLFNMYTENIFGAINTNKGTTIGGTTINNLRDADETVLLADTEEDLQAILNEVNRIGKTFHMKMNAKKIIKTMLVSEDETLTKVSLKIGGDIIKRIDNCMPHLLGQTITSNGKCDGEILRKKN